jgi:hypothetical protein
MLAEVFHVGDFDGNDFDVCDSHGFPSGKRSAISGQQSAEIDEDWDLSYLSFPAARAARIFLVRG